MGRTLANTMVNLGIVTSVDEALYQVDLRFSKYFLLLLERYVPNVGKRSI